MRPQAAHRDSLIPIGIVGGGAAWAGLYWPAISELKRGRVVSVHSPRCHETDLLSQALAVPGYLSLRQMLRQAGLRALLILEQGQIRDWSIQLALEHQIPTLVADPIDDQLAEKVSQLVEYESEGHSVIPGLLLRMTPSSLRLRELMATQLGAIQSVRVSLPNTGSLHLISVIDWCRSMIGSVASHLTRSCCEDMEIWKMTCGRRSPLTRMVTTEVIRQPMEPLEHPWEIRVVCERGESVLKGPSQLTWNTGTESFQEQLQGDRTAEQVLLDLFLRRVVGGVVPIPSWSELGEACRLWKQAKLES